MAKMDLIFWYEIISLFFVEVYTKSVNESRREKILREEFEMSIGGKVILSEKENQLNDMLMQWKYKEADEWFKNPVNYVFSKKYFEYKSTIKKSPVYNFIRAMPKGALLHIHANAVLGPDFFLNMTYRDHLYMCIDQKIDFIFSFATPAGSCKSKWFLMKDIRQSVKNVTSFDIKLMKQFTLEGWKYENSDDIWKRFGDIFSLLYPFWSYVPVWEEYFYKMLKEIREDNIFYVEFRSSLPEMYDLNGRVYDELFFVNVTQRVLENFKKDYPDFLGARMICAFNRKTTPNRIEELISLTKRLKTVYPDFIAGFDLVSKEDSSPLVEFNPILEAAEEDLNYYFHAGETNWYGTTTDENLIDAVVLGSKRIGHAFALLKHPGVLNIVKEKGICIEACVVSNAVLGLLEETRVHPLAAWIAQGLPVTLAGDDPGFWDAHPLTTDFYVTFQGIASRKHDLRLLKQFALNSIQYSAMSSKEKKSALTLFDKKWNEFVNYFLEKYQQANSNATPMLVNDTLTNIDQQEQK